MVKLGDPKSEDQIERIFNIADPDGNGTIDFKGFVDIVEGSKLDWLRVFMESENKGSKKVQVNLMNPQASVQVVEEANSSDGGIRV